MPVNHRSALHYEQQLRSMIHDSFVFKFLEGCIEQLDCALLFKFYCNALPAGTEIEALRYIVQFRSRSYFKILCVNFLEGPIYLYCNPSRILIGSNYLRKQYNVITVHQKCQKMSALRRYYMSFLSLSIWPYLLLSLMHLMRLNGPNSCLLFYCAESF